MTSQKESWTAGREALREVTKRADRTDRREDALNRYLAGATNAEQQRHTATARNDEPER
jgi:hypothetical protein